MSSVVKNSDYEGNVDVLTAKFGIGIAQNYLFLSYSKIKTKYISNYVQLIWNFHNPRDYTPISVIEESQKIFRLNKEREHNALWKSYCALGLRELAIDFHTVDKIENIRNQGKVDWLPSYLDEAKSHKSEYDSLFIYHEALNFITHLKPKKALNLLQKSGLFKTEKIINPRVLDTIIMSYLDLIYIIFGGK